jgi:AcrR family transcriptional regulator
VRSFFLAGIVALNHDLRVAAALAAHLPRRARKKLAVRDRLLAEARRLFRAHGLAGAGVADIAEAADVAPGTFFNYFASKDALVAELTTHALDPLVALLEGPGEAGPRVAAFFERAPEALAPAYAELGDLFRPLLRRAATPPPELDPLAGLRQAWSRLLFEAQREGAVRRDVEAAYLAELVVGALHAALVEALRDPRYPLARRLAQLAAFVAAGLELRDSPPRR